MGRERLIASVKNAWITQALFTMFNKINKDKGDRLRVLIGLNYLIDVQ